MSISLPSLVDNLCEIYNKERRVFKQRRIKSVCDLIGVKNNKLHYKCTEYKKRQLKPIKRLIKKVFKYEQIFQCRH